MNPNDSDASRFKSAATDRRGERDLDLLLGHGARGDTEAFEAVYDRLVGPVYGVIRRVLRDPSQSEEVAQEVLLEVWRTAARFDPAIGGAATWVMTIAHRRAVDRVRSTTAAADREHKTAEVHTPHDEVAEAVEASLDRERVRRCLEGLTDVQRQAITAAAEPPAELRGRVLAAAARTRQLPPEVSTHARPRRSRTGVPWVPWLSGVVATASIVLAVLFGFAQAHTRDELNQVKAENQAISLLLSAPEAKLLTHPVTNGGVATVVLAADRHELAVVTTGLPALAPGKVYQLWLIGKPKA